MRRLFGTDGVRGTANEFLSCELTMSIGRALGFLLSSNNRYKPRIIIGSDTRISSEMLSAALCAGLCSVGCEVLNLGVVPTPAVAYLVKKYKAKAGVMISASHNTYEYNGIKVFGEDGYKLSDELEEQIESIVLDNPTDIKLAESSAIGRCINMDGALSDYIDYLVGAADIRLDGMKIAVDCSNGSASVTAGELFSRLGATVHTLFAEPNGVNINAGCGSTHIDALKKYVVENRLDLGLAFDGDADRCLAVDELGHEIDGDIIMAILALDMKEKGCLAKNTVVGTVMSNFGFIKFCEENDIDFVAAKVGDRYVLEIMNQEGYSLGGEQSGHIILPRYATTGDGQLTGVALLSRVAESKKSLSELSRVMKKYPQHIVNIEATQNEKIALFTNEEIRDIISRTERELEGRGRLVIRPSGTEPLIRIMVECDDEAYTESLAKKTAELIKESLRGY